MVLCLVQLGRCLLILCSDQQGRFILLLCLNQQGRYLLVLCLDQHGRCAGQMYVILYRAGVCSSVHMVLLDFVFFENRNGR